MADGLRCLIRLAEIEIDEARREVRACGGVVDAISRQIDNLIRSVAHEQAAASADVEVALPAYGAFAKACVLRRAELEADLKAAEATLAAARATLLERHRHRRSLELADAMRVARAQEEAARREQAELEEIAVDRFRAALHSP